MQEIKEIGTIEDADNLNVSDKIASDKAMIMVLSKKSAQRLKAAIAEVSEAIDAIGL